MKSNNTAAGSRVVLTAGAGLHTERAARLNEMNAVARVATPKAPMACATASSMHLNIQRPGMWSGDANACSITARARSARLALITPKINIAQLVGGEPG